MLPEALAAEVVERGWAVEPSAVNVTYGKNVTMKETVTGGTETVEPEPSIAPQDDDEDVEDFTDKAPKGLSPTITQILGGHVKWYNVDELQST